MYLFSMRIFCLLVVLACCGCGDPDRQRIVGTWEMLTADALADRMTGESPKKPALEGNGPSSMTLTFHRSGALTTRTRIGKIDSEKSGRWTFLGFEPPAELTIACDMEGLHSEHLVRWTGDDIIRLTPPNMSGQKMKLDFRKTD